MFGYRGTRRRAATALLLAGLCLLLVGWRGIGPWLGKAHPETARPAGASTQAGSPASGQTLPIAESGAAESRLVAAGPVADTDAGDRSAGYATLVPSAAAGSSAAPSATVSAAAVAPPATGSAAATASSATGNKAAQPLFPGIADSVTQKWTFPMKYAPNTPGIGVFGASRSNGRLHAGIDLYAPQGTPIYAMAAGRVRQVEVFYQGLMSIEVENRDGTTIRYCELVNTVHIGDRVSQGQLLGHLKRNYDGTCMLHLEIYASIRSAPLTQVDNQSDYPLVPAKSKTRSFRRRSDLVDPGAVYALPAPGDSASR